MKTGLQKYKRILGSGSFNQAVHIEWLEFLVPIREVGIKNRRPIKHKEGFRVFLQPIRVNSGIKFMILYQIIAPTGPNSRMIVRKFHCKGKNRNILKLVAETSV